MANYTPSLITFSPPLTNLAEKPKEKEPGNEKEDEKKMQLNEDLRKYLRSNITHGAPLEKVF